MPKSTWKQSSTILTSREIEITPLKWLFSGTQIEESNVIAEELLLYEEI